MKVIVRCANNRVTKADMEREIERLFQENKDLRLSESHLRDEVNILRQQSEARRQVICEHDKLIQELNEEVQASNDELENVQCDLVDHVKLQEEMCDTIDDLRTKVANACAERDNFEASYKQVLQWWEEAQSRAIKAEAAAEEYHIALMESDCRVDECEKRMDWLSKEVLEWKATAEGYKNQYEELKAQKEADDKKSEEICTACNERYEEVLSDRNRLREEVALLTHKRDTAVHENTEMMFYIYDLQEDHKELEANFSELEQVHKLWGEEIDRLRKVVTELQTNRFTADEFIGMIMKNFVPSTDK